MAITDTDDSSTSAAKSNAESNAESSSPHTHPSADSRGAFKPLSSSGRGIEGEGAALHHRDTVMNNEKNNAAPHASPNATSQITSHATPHAVVNTEARDEMFTRSLVGILKEAIFSDLRRQAEALADAMAITGRSKTSIYNWFVKGEAAPDLATFFKLALYYNVDLNGTKMRAALRILNPDIPEPVISEVTVDCLALKPLSEHLTLKKALHLYTDNPTYTIFTIYSGEDVPNYVRRDQLILVDVSAETINRDGIYLLKVSGRTVLRIAQMGLSTNAITLAALNPDYKHLNEIVSPDADGNIPGVHVHGRVVGVLKP